MKWSSTTTVIGICSPSGGGKTALVAELSARIKDSAAICFDDYGDPFWDIPDLEKWIEYGADLNKITTPQLAADLEALRNGKTILSPRTREMIEPKAIILFDTLVGRAHHATGKFIDLLVYIDTPLALALSRRMMRSLSEITGGNLNAADTRAKIDNLCEYLEAYASQTGPRQIYQAIQNQVKKDSDLVLNGEKTICSLAAEVLSALNDDPD